MISEAPIGEIIAATARGIAQGQRALDAACLACAEQSARDPWWQLGYVPTFYQFVETTITLKLALRWDTSNGERCLRAATVGAAYTGAYGFELRAAATVRVEVVPVPPPLLQNALRGGLENR